MNVTSFIISSARNLCPPNERKQHCGCVLQRFFPLKCLLGKQSVALTLRRRDRFALSGAKLVEWWSGRESGQCAPLHHPRRPLTLRCLCLCLPPCNDHQTSRTWFAFSMSICPPVIRIIEVAQAVVFTLPSC